ncbi:MAG: aminoacyl-tRNA hydrolase [Candidatus Omnitrophota bacterium]|jgi:PTH1 family peptidyl-tRNA hydrolase
MALKLVVGLGNPGTAYSATRHNIGRRLAVQCARRFALSFSKLKSCQSDVARSQVGGSEVVVACPHNFMNLSGRSVAALCRHFELQDGGDLLVLVDDAALGFGRLRLRAGGSDGGHNGLKSITADLGISRFARLRIGIGHSAPALARVFGPPESVPLEEFVLSDFLSEEEKAIPALLDRGVEAVCLWIQEPIEKAMNVVNHSDHSS